ncbi:zinc ABC transporter substrate-binding protein [Alginatibacterium sediminis]|uniref:High-affinity zinc uptake system protein ZnuA n=1 Tax=Alginatibacterium sediminis TaxID=2164068 RepID=A0A420EMZ1_9ALTE|nr:zinc ABC transporter substrate-binding protein [Alginatibacterium sediminis]RKF22079.1 zinc ABC transporter substrate-binding protein [Alginatibacterium sediminis]
MNFRLAMLAALSFLISSHSVADQQEPKVISSIKPLALLVTSLTQGEIKGEYLIDPSLSPHDYALRPSDVRALRQSDLVIWVSDSLEPFLEAPLTQNKSNNLPLLSLPNMPVIEHGHDDHESENDSHEGHSHDIDPHIWLGYNQIQIAALAITEELIRLQPELESHRREQLLTFLTRLEQQHKELSDQLAPIQNVGFFVFHDGYSYFEQSFGLKRLGEFTINPQQQAGAKTIQSIRQSLANGETDCIFAEPQFEGAMLQRLAQDTQVTIGILDPLGIDTINNADGYFMLIDEMAKSFTSCLK